MKLENLIGDLRAYNLLEPGTFQHANELMDETWRDTELQFWSFFRDNVETRVQISGPKINYRDNDYLTADGMIYHLMNGVPTLSIVREKDNLVLRHLNDPTNSSFEQLMHTRIYQCDLREAQAAIAAPETVSIDLTKLGHEDESSLTGKKFWVIGSDEQIYHILTFRSDGISSYYHPYNIEEERLLERLYGEATFRNREKISKLISGRADIYVLHPEYVRAHATKSPIAQVCVTNLSNRTMRSTHLNDYKFNLRGTVRPIVSDFTIRDQVVQWSRCYTPEGLGERFQDELLQLSSVSPDLREIKLATIDEVLKCSARFVPEIYRKNFKKKIQELYKC